MAADRFYVKVLKFVEREPPDSQLRLVSAINPSPDVHVDALHTTVTEFPSAMYSGVV